MLATKQKKKTKKWKKILLIVLAVLAAGLIALYIWQGENIRALFKALTTDPDVLASRLEDMRNEHHKNIEDDLNITLPVRPVSADQSKDLLNGNKTPEEVKQEIGVTSSQTQDGTKEDIVSRCVAELYAYKADVMGYLGGLKQAAIDKWNALPADQRTTAKKSEIMMDGVSQCYDYEVVVDGRVQEILDVYRTKMKAIGEDTQPIDVLWNYYCDEKEAEKAYYFGQYLN